MSEYDRLKAQYDAICARKRPALPRLSELPTMDVSAFRAALREVVPPVVVTRYGQPVWVVWTADFYEEDLQISAPPSSEEQPLIPSEASTAALATDKPILRSTKGGGK